MHLRTSLGCLFYDPLHLLGNCVYEVFWVVASAAADSAAVSRLTAAVAAAAAAALAAAVVVELPSS
jgi:hypothetical protein